MRRVLGVPAGILQSGGARIAQRPNSSVVVVCGTVTWHVRYTELRCGRGHSLDRPRYGRLASIS